MLSVVITEPGWCSGESTQPPTNVAWIQILMSTLYMYVGWVCCWFSPFLREVFLRVLRFAPFLKNHTSKFQLDQESVLLDDEPPSGSATSKSLFIIFLFKK